MNTGSMKQQEFYIAACRFPNRLFVTFAKTAMKEKLIISCIFFLIAGSINAQSFKGQIELAEIPAPAGHYQQEYLFDTTINKTAWGNLAKGMHVSFASTDELYFRSEVPQLDQETTEWKATGWKGERLNAVVLTWSADTIEQVRFISSDLKNKNGKVIGRSNLDVSMVRYVVSNYPYGAKDVTCEASPYKDVYLMPDRFEKFERFDVPANSVRPVWISVNIPAGTDAGEYTGAIEVKAADHSSMLNLTITVQNQELPKPHEWKHSLDLWAESMGGCLGK